MNVSLPTLSSLFALIRNGASWAAIGTAVANVGAHGGLRIAQLIAGAAVQIVEHWGTIAGTTSSPAPSTTTTPAGTGTSTTTPAAPAAHVVRP